jgi:hypothetical protein
MYCDLLLKIHIGRDRSSSMTDWLDDVFKKVDAQEDSRQRDRDWQIRCDAKIQAHAPGLFKKLKDDVKEYVGRINIKYDANPSRQIAFEEQRPSGERFAIATRYYPKSQVALWLNRELQVIEVTVTAKADREDPEIIDREFQWHLAVDDQNQICVRADGAPKTNEELASLIISPLMLR